MSNFDTAVLTVLKHEGGYSNDPQDPGGATNYGISLRFLKRVNPNATIEDIKNMTPEGASELYKKYWWDEYQYDRIINQQIATKVLVLAVNMPEQEAHRSLQRAVRASSGEILNEDGILGDKSIQAVNNANPSELLASFRSEAAAYYRSLHQPKFINGWLARAYE